MGLASEILVDGTVDKFENRCSFAIMPPLLIADKQAARADARKNMAIDDLRDSTAFLTDSRNALGIIGGEFDFYEIAVDLGAGR